MSIFQVLIESRIDDVRRRYPMFKKEEYPIISAIDPSKSKKYVMWIAREFDEETNKNQYEIPDHLISITKKALLNWEQYVNRITIKHLEEYNEHFSPRIIINDPLIGREKDIYSYDLEQVINLGKYFETIPTKKCFTCYCKKTNKSNI
jgi:hypothetical protein